MADDPRRPIYLDNQASAPTDPRVVAAMLPYFTDICGNPHNRGHAAGRRAANAIEQARAEIAALIGAQPEEIIFTAGATEANNLALQGVLAQLGPSRDHLIASAIDHSSVLAVCDILKSRGHRVTLVPVERCGQIDPGRIAAAIDDRTALVSVAAVNNEIGTIQPIADIGRICRARGVPFHTDAAQAAGRIPLDVAAQGIDLLSLSGHKLHGPKGIGVLYVRDGYGHRPAPLLYGGGQEQGLRPGTLPTPLCVGLGTACALAAREMDSEQPRIRALRDGLWQRLKDAVPGLILAGDPGRRIAGNLMLIVPGGDAVDIQTELAADIALSTGSACASGSGKPSHVLTALGFDATAAAGALRLSLGRFTTQADIDDAADLLIRVLRRS